VFGVLFPRTNLTIYVFYLVNSVIYLSFKNFIGVYLIVHSKGFHYGIFIHMYNVLIFTHVIILSYLLFSFTLCPFPSPS
jgi:hypothetical protein